MHKIVDYYLKKIIYNIKVFYSTNRKLWFKIIIVVFGVKYFTAKL